MLTGSKPCKALGVMSSVRLIICTSSTLKINSKFRRPVYNFSSLNTQNYLAERIATKTEERYEKIISLIRVSSHGKRKGAEKIEDIEITCDEARIP